MGKSWNPAEKSQVLQTFVHHIKVYSFFLRNIMANILKYVIIFFIGKSKFNDSLENYKTSLYMIECTRRFILLGLVSEKK